LLKKEGRTTTLEEHTLRAYVKNYLNQGDAIALSVSARNSVFNGSMECDPNEENVSGSWEEYGTEHRLSDLNLRRITQALIREIKGYQPLSQEQIADLGSSLAEISSVERVNIRNIEQGLDIYLLRIDDEGLKEAFEILKPYRDSIINMEIWSDAGLIPIKSLPNLEILDLYGCKNITNAGMKHVRDMQQNLTTVVLKDTGINQFGIDYLRGYIPDIKV
jgi:hypothetical protein